MNIRTEEIKRESEDIMGTRIQYSEYRILEYFQCHREELLKDTLRQLAELLEKNQEKEISYLQISYLHTTLLSGTYHYLAVLYDSLYYLDVKSASCELTLDFIYQFFTEDIEYLSRKLEEKYHRLYSNDIMAMKEACNRYYIGIVLNYLELVLEELVQADVFRKMKKQSSFKILFGEYMGKGKTVYEVSDGYA